MNDVEVTDARRDLFHFTDKQQRVLLSTAVTLATSKQFRESYIIVVLLKGL